MARGPAGKRKPKPSSARGGTGIANHPLDEELRRQRQLPPRGYRKRGTRVDRPVEPAPVPRRGRSGDPEFQKPNRRASR
jgi:hypothetical protein